MQASLRSACARPLALARPARAARRAVAAAPRAAAGESTSGPLGGLINAIAKAVQNSPLAAGKQALAESQAAGYDPALAAAKVDALVAENAVFMFSFSGCPFCKSAKKILDAEGAKYIALELDEMGLVSSAASLSCQSKQKPSNQPTNQPTNH